MGDYVRVRNHLLFHSQPRAWSSGARAHAVSLALHMGAIALLMTADAGPAPPSRPQSAASRTMLFIARPELELPPLKARTREHQVPERTAPVRRATVERVKFPEPLVVESPQQRQLSATAAPRLEAEIPPLPVSLAVVAAPAAPRKPAPAMRTGVLGEPQAAGAIDPQRTEVRTERFMRSRAVRTEGVPAGGSEARLGTFALARDLQRGGGDQYVAERIAAHGAGFGAVHGSGPSVSSGQTAAQTVGFNSVGFGEPAVASEGAARAAGFVDAAVAQVARQDPVGSSETLAGGVKVLFKPKPEYSAEAREQRVEGEVLLEVVFRASGEITVLRVIQRLGHGLDETAVEAARRIRFEPARAGGRAVDSTAIVRILFQLAF